MNAGAQSVSMMDGKARNGASGAVPRDAAERFDWRLLLIAYVVVAGFAVAKAILTVKTIPLLDDTDDAMRLTTVRDLVAGQGWWDHIQHRLNAPYGAEIHWSHLIDAAIGGLLLVFRPFAGSFAETLTVYTWPLLLLFLLLTLSGRLAFRLGGREAMLPALLLPVVSPAAMVEFSPGRIDHHSITILLTLTMAWSVIESMKRPRFAILAGLAAALSLGIAIEGIPSVASAVLGIALIWVFVPGRAGAMRAFGIAFALGSIAMVINQYPPSRWFVPACDEISIVYAAFGVGVGAVLVALSLLPFESRSWRIRLGVGAALAAVLAVALAVAFPLCLKGPYAALDPWLVEHWLSTITEARTVRESLAADPALTLGIALPPLLGLVVVLARVWRGPVEGRGEWLLYGLFLLVAVAVMMEEIRGGRIAGALTFPAAGWLIAMARRHYLGGHPLAGALALVGSWLGFAGFVLMLAAVLLAMPFEAKAEAKPQPAPAAATSPNSGLSCYMPGSFGALAALPPSRIMAPIDLGSHILAFTPHAVVGAAYHRDQAGLLDTFHFFNQPIAEARQILTARGIGLVVVCPGLPELGGLADASPDSFVKLYAAGTLPSWLEPLSAPGDALKIYRVAAP